MDVKALALASPGFTRPKATEIDGALLLRAKQQEDEACRLLFRRYHPQVHALLYRMLGPKLGAAVVEELSQETFLRVFHRLSDFDPERGTRLSSWILTIATRLALNALRRRPHEALEGDVSTQSDSASQGELAEGIANAVLALPIEQRTAFVLREYHELDYNEIATALDISIGTVKSRLSRARVFLRAILMEHRS